MRTATVLVLRQNAYVLETSARLLRLLGLFQSRSAWTAPELALRLGVTERTVRRDVTRLRDLGYPVGGRPGADGGYRLGSGSTVPPLLLDDDEVVAVAVGLSAAADGSVGGLDEAAVRALAKLERVLPARLRPRLASVRAATVALGPGGPAVDPEALTVLATACDVHERVRFGYVTRDGSAGQRTVEPHRLVLAGRRWYLVARDLAVPDGDPWRTYRLDRIGDVRRTGVPFRPGETPDAAAFVAHGISTGHTGGSCGRWSRLRRTSWPPSCRRRSPWWRRWTSSSACSSAARTRSTAWPCTSGSWAPSSASPSGCWSPRSC